MASRHRLLKCALEKYIDEMGGQVHEDAGNLEIIVPIAIEEVPGGVQFTLRGRIEGEYVVIEEVMVSYHDEQAIIKPIDLESWIHYVNERFSPLCKQD